MWREAHTSLLETMSYESTFWRASIKVLSCALYYYGVWCMQCGRVLQPWDKRQEPLSLLHIRVVSTQCYNIAGWVTFACNIHHVCGIVRGHKSTQLWEMIIPLAEETWIGIKGIIRRTSSCMTVGAITYWLKIFHLARTIIYMRSQSFATYRM